MIKCFATRGRVICLLYALSGFAGLTFETVWIRTFATSFGSTLLSFSTVIGVYLGGLALGAAGIGWLRPRRGLLWYGLAEIAIGTYALAVPSLVEHSTSLLAPLYVFSSEGTLLAAGRAFLCAAILLPPTMLMGASLPWLVSWLNHHDTSPGSSWIYAANTTGGAAGAAFAGLFLLPAIGYQRTAFTAGVLDIAAGVASLWVARKAFSEAAPQAKPGPEPQTPMVATPMPVLCAVALLTGCCVMLCEVSWNRVAILLFGPTAATVSLTLAVVLIGIATGATIASATRRNPAGWLAYSQLAVTILLFGFSLLVTVSPFWLVEQIRLRNEDPLQMELFEAGCLFLFLFPAAMAAGMALPLALRLLGPQRADRVGQLYGLNTAGCIGGALAGGWLLLPHLGMERTIYVGALLSGCASVLLIEATSPVRARRTAGILAVALPVGALLVPHWDLPAMTAGAYKYAPYYNQEITAELHRGELRYLREGKTGVVTVRRIDGSLVLAIDGKVDAGDSGGDLLTERLLAHLPLRQVRQPRTVCVIGLASGVTAGTALQYPIQRLDIVELSPEVVEASHQFDSVNGRPLADRRARLIVNDGRNHLALTGQRYDAILSEPSNPWIAGMNSLFTREFFLQARRRLNPGGVLGQWFHLYNMPPEDLRSLLRAFTDVFPDAALWQLNDGDVLLTSGSDETAPERVESTAEAPETDTAFLSTLYLMRGADLVRFAAPAEPNSDDRPVLEFHGQRNLHSQTDAVDLREIAEAPKLVAAPSWVLARWQSMPAEQWVERGRIFEKAESYRMAFGSYQKALATRPDLTEALAGLMRSARTAEERAIAGTFESRTREALNDAQAGNTIAAEMILRAVKEAFPQTPESMFNYGLFCLERGRYEDAIANLNAAMAVQKDYLPALEAMAEIYLRKRDFQNAALWSRRILQIDPDHTIARQTFAGLERR